MKKSIMLGLLMLTITAFSQRFERLTSTYTSFKRHFSYSIEGGFVDNLPRQFIAGNKSDWLTDPAGAQVIQGNSISGINILPGGIGTVSVLENILLTDFIVPVQDGNDLYGYGTGIYYPQGENSNSYVFFATYERRSMTPVSIVYYDLLYSDAASPQNTAGTRIK